MPGAVISLGGMPSSPYMRGALKLEDGRVPPSHKQAKVPMPKPDDQLTKEELLKLVKRLRKNRQVGTAQSR